MGITVADLVEMQHLRLTLHSGAGGLGRAVSWTHTSDLPEPWRWLAGGELLLTNGMSFPADGAAQADLVRALVDAGASGLAIGEQMYCPPLTDDLVKVSEELDFSVLMVGYPLPFVAISQAVAAGTLLEQSDRLVRTERIYRTVQRLVTTGGNASVLLPMLAQLLGCEAHLCDRDSVQPWYPADPRFTSELTEAISAVTGGAAELRAGAFSARLAGGRELRLIDVPTQPGAVLALVASAGSFLDAILMQHAVTVVALEMSQTVVRIEQERRTGAELLAKLVDGQLDPRGGLRQLRSFGLDDARVRLFAVTSEDSARLRELHVVLWRRGLRPLILVRRGVYLVLCVDDESAPSVLRESVGDDALIGVSGPRVSVERMPEALREATWAVRAAAEVSTRTFRYGDQTPLLGVAGVDDARALVARVLGAVQDYERAHDSELIRTLETYLQHKRSWQKSADALQVHRQTVLYRIRKVEEISGRDLSSTEDIAEMWLALRARNLLDRNQPGRSAKV